ncbi:hypothetical protein F511_30378 [Dorcoceras hygrometricum]|uniref:Uncharacterized protein n=1 Tax=Dorcoceras hygrometricum TaxID=472368 RepID=A0A2Z7C942_9LAMI|nr:hypothetical protein F511_30378 [Dorcoceras hygrometricum]
MSSPSDSPVSSTAASIDGTSPRRQAGEPWLPEPEELLNTPWYEEKSSNIKLSDIAIVKEKGGTMGRYICNMAPDRDIQVLKKADDAEVVGHFSTNIASMKASRKNFDKAMGQHTEAMARLEELEAHRARELETTKAQRESLEAELVAEKEARALEREALVAELERANAWVGQEAERMKTEAREEFLKSPEFDSLLAKRAWGYFKDGFWGCLAQFRANGYSEKEHPASFLDLQQALADMGDEEEAEEEEEEGDDANASPPKSPPS